MIPMKKTLALLAVFALFGAANDFTTIGIGDAMPAADLELTNTDGVKTSLSQLKGKKGTLVIFSCNTCPFVVGNNDDSEGWEGRYNKVTGAARVAGVSTVLVNSNEAKRDKGDDLASMKERKKNQLLLAHYVLDEKSAVADAFGARTTPHVFLFDNEDKLIYSGAIDDNVQSAEKVTEHWLEDALAAYSRGEKIEPATTRNVGCSIKRVKKD